MSTAFSVDLDHLDRVVRHLAAFEKDVDAQLNKLDQHLTRLQQYWTGDTSDAEAAAHADWMVAAREMHTGLAAIRAAAHIAHTNYTRAVAANVAMWQF